MLVWNRARIRVPGEHLSVARQSPESCQPQPDGGDRQEPYAASRAYRLNAGRVVVGLEKGGQRYAAVGGRIRGPGRYDESAGQTEQYGGEDSLRETLRLLGRATAHERHQFDERERRTCWSVSMTHASPPSWWKVSRATDRPAG